MTPREIFNTVKTHLLTQGEQAFNANVGQCVYRTDDGRKCAVGCLISDEAYSPGIEGFGIAKSTVQYALTISGIELTDNVKRLLRALQDVHDDYEPDEWEDQLNRIVKRLDEGFYG